MTMTLPPVGVGPLDSTLHSNICRPHSAAPIPLPHSACPFFACTLCALLLSDGDAAAQPHRSGHRRRAPPSTRRRSASSASLPPSYPAIQVAWIRLPGTPGVAFHIIERDPAAAPASVSPVAPAEQLRRRHHLAFSVANYDGFVAGLKARSTDMFEFRGDAARRATAARSRSSSPTPTAMALKLQA